MSSTMTVTEVDTQKAIDLNYTSHPADLVDGGVCLLLFMFGLIAHLDIENQLQGYGRRLT